MNMKSYYFDQYTQKEKELLRKNREIMHLKMGIKTLGNHIHADGFIENKSGKWYLCDKNSNIVLCEISLVGLILKLGK